MGSIWDRPQAQGDTAPLGHGTTRPAGNVPIVPPENRVYGREGGRPLLDRSGRGVYKGVPLGETRQVEERALEDEYRFRPAWLAALRGATRKALRR